MVAQVAADEPETAAKMVQPMMLVWTRRPGRRRIHGARPRNISSEMAVRNSTSPIQTKSGSAVSVHDERSEKMTVAIASPAGLAGANIHITAIETPIMLRPIQTPVPNRKKRAQTASRAIWASTPVMAQRSR